MSHAELRTLRLIALIITGIAALQAAQGNWATAGMTLVALSVFSAIAVWRSKHRTAPAERPEEEEVRTRKLIARALPFLLVFFVGFGVLNALAGYWFGVAWAGVCFGVAVIGALLNRRRLSELPASRP